MPTPLRGDAAGAADALHHVRGHRSEPPAEERHGGEVSSVTCASVPICRHRNWTRTKQICTIQAACPRNAEFYAIVSAQTGTQKEIQAICWLLPRCVIAISGSDPTESMHCCAIPRLHLFALAWLENFPGVFFSQKNVISYTRAYRLCSAMLTSDGWGSPSIQSRDSS